MGAEGQGEWTEEQQHRHRIFLEVNVELGDVFMQSRPSGVLSRLALRINTVLSDKNRQYISKPRRKKKKTHMLLNILF